MFRTRKDFMKVAPGVLATAGLVTAVACTRSNDESLPAVEIQAALVSSKLDLPKDLTGTKLFESGNPMEPRFGVLPYQVKVPLWSDGAVKTRFAFVPPASQVSWNSEKQAYTFPIGTTFIKHFATGSGDPVETRMIVLKSDNTWRYVTYVWKDGNVNEANTYPTTVAGKDGLDYRIPSESECKSCHVEEGYASPILGFNPEQLNFKPEGAAKSQLEQLLAQDLFDKSTEAASQKTALPDPGDASLSLEQRTRSYLAVNCSPCHRPGGAAADQEMDMRFEKDFASTGLVSTGRVVPGKSAESLLWQKFSATTNRMPALSIRHDPRGLELIPQWIDSLK